MISCFCLFSNLKVITIRIKNCYKLNFDSVNAQNKKENFNNYKKILNINKRIIESSKFSLEKFNKSCLLFIQDKELFLNNNYFNAPGFFNTAQVVYDGSGTHTELDPGFVDVAAGNFTITNQTLLDNMVGDPRWRP